MASKKTPTRKAPALAARPLSPARQKFTVAIVSKKGGVAKSTTALHLAWHAAKAGIPTLAWDFDQSPGLTHIVFGQDAIEEFEKQGATSFDVLARFRTAAECSLLISENFRFIPAAPSILSKFRLLSRTQKSELLTDIINEDCDELLHIVDVHPDSIENPLVENAIVAADLAIIPTPPEGPDKDSIPEILEPLQAEANRRSRKGLRPLEIVIVITRAKSNFSHHQIVCEEILQHYGGTVFPTAIPERAVIGQQNLAFDPDGFQSIPEYAELSKLVIKKCRKANRKRN